LAWWLEGLVQAMIAASTWNYANNFFDFAKQFIRALSVGDFGAALSRLDQSRHRWTRNELETLLRRHEAGTVTSPDGHARSAEPTLIQTASNDLFEVLHRLPIDGRWSNTAVRLRFTRAKGDYFRAELVGLEALR
jgi:hypothetical protein